MGLVAAVAIVLFTANVRITNAQQQQFMSQPAATQNATLFQSTEDSFRVQVPKGWVIHQFNDTGSTLLAEVLQGYGLLAQLCPEQQQAFRNVGASGSTFGSCQGSEDNIIHIIRYPNLGAILGLTSRNIIANNSNNTINNILSYQIQKLEEVGYRDIKIVNSTDTRINVANTGGINNNNNNATSTTTTIPAKLVEMTYSTNFAPNEVRRGYFISTATDATPHNLGIITGYGIFYEGGAAAAAAAAASANSAPTPLTAPVRQVFGSFELIAAKEGAAEAGHAVNTQPNPERTNHAGDASNHNSGTQHHRGTASEDGKVHGKAATGPYNDYGADCDGCDGSNGNSRGGTDGKVHGKAATGPYNDYG
jgi:hypothetical protein